MVRTIYHLRKLVEEMDCSMVVRSGSSIKVHVEEKNVHWDIQDEERKGHKEQRDKNLFLILLNF